MCKRITPKEAVTCCIAREKYRLMLNNVFNISLQQKQYLEKNFFWETEAPPLVLLRVQKLLRQKFTTERVIRCFPTSCLPFSVDHIPCDFCSWCYIMFKVYHGGVPKLAILKIKVSKTFIKGSVSIKTRISCKFN